MYLILLFSSIANSCFSSEKENIIQNYLGKTINSNEVLELTKKLSLQKQILKGELMLFSKENGIQVLFQKNKVWRIILITKKDSGYEVFKGDLPLNLKPEFKINEILKNAGQPQYINDKVKPDKIFYYDRGEFTYRLLLNNDIFFRLSIRENSNIKKDKNRPED